MEKRVRIWCITSKQAGTNNSLESTSPRHVFFPQPEAIAVTGASACAPYHCGSGKHTCLRVRFEGLCFKMIQNVVIDSPSSSFTFLLDLYKWLFCSCIIHCILYVCNQEGDDTGLFDWPESSTLSAALKSLVAETNQSPDVGKARVQATKMWKLLWFSHVRCVSLVTLENHFAVLYAPMNLQVNFSAQQHLYVTKLRDEIRKSMKLQRFP